MTRKLIILVTDRDEAEDLVALGLESLRKKSKSYPTLKRFMNAALKRRSSSDSGLAELQSRITSKQSDPVLVIVDALVRRISHESTPGNGKGATEILEWLAAHKQDTPVLVLSEEPIQHLNLKALTRRNVALWALSPSEHTTPSTAFAEMLSSLGSTAARHPKRITVEVGRSSAKYRIKDGYCEFTTSSIPYTDLGTLKSLIEASETFSPYDPNQKARGDWQVTLGLQGKLLFQILLQDPLGPAFLEMFEEVHVSNPTTAQQFDIDMRFDIDLSVPESEQLFGLPFEVVNHDSQLDSFLCARVPMARRIRLQTDDMKQRSGRAANPWDTESSKLKILFVDAGLASTVSVIHETTGQKLPNKSLPPLTNTVREGEVLENLAAISTNIETLTMIGGGKEVGHQLRELIEDSLSQGHYDVFHFSGHSLAHEGGTFLVLPGEGGTGLSVSVREVADWARQGGCRLVVLSSCRGGSLRTAIETMRAGVDAVLGFRWDVVDDTAVVDYFRRFYDAYLGERKSLTAAYREACRSVRTSARGTPIWASAVAVVRD